MKKRPSRWLPDAVRMSYTKRVTTPDGTEMFVRAMRKENVDVIGELTWWLPTPVYLVAEVIRELRTRGKYEGIWLVEVGHRWGFKKNVKLGEFPKAEALDLVNARADEIARGSSS